MNAICPESLVGKAVTIQGKPGFTFHGILQNENGANAVVTSDDGSILLFSLDFVNFPDLKPAEIWVQKSFLGKIDPFAECSQISQIRMQINKAQDEITRDALKELRIEPDGSVIDSQPGLTANGEPSRVLSHKGRRFLEFKDSENTTPSLHSNFTFRFAIFYHLIK